MISTAGLSWGAYDPKSDQRRDPSPEYSSGRVTKINDSFRMYLRGRGVEETDWLQQISRGEPKAFELHSAWEQTEEDRLRRDGTLAEFTPRALEELGISLRDWREMKPRERFDTATRWLNQRREP
jgi:hypothetical protein